MLSHIGVNIPKVELKWEEGELLLLRHYKWEPFRNSIESRKLEKMLGFLALATFSKFSFFKSAQDDLVNPTASLISFEFSSPFQFHGSETVVQSFFKALKNENDGFRTNTVNIEVPYFIHRGPLEREDLRNIRGLAYQIYDMPVEVVRDIINDVFFQVYNYVSKKQALLQ